MLLKRTHFDLNNRCLIEKVVIQTPMRYQAMFPNEACFLHFKSGQLTLSAAEEQKKIQASESVLLNCGHYFADLIQERPNDTIEIIAIHLYPELLHEIYHSEIHESVKKSQSKVTINTISNNAIIIQYIQGLNLYFENPALLTNELLVLKIKELILLLLQSDKAATINELFQQLFSPKELVIKEMIQAHLFSNLSISELAMLANQSLSTFKREFETIFNDTPANYIRIKRVEKAQQLLHDTKLSISEICYQTGFSDVSHFSKVFKKQIGITPIEFRRQCN